MATHSISERRRFHRRRKLKKPGTAARRRAPYLERLEPRLLLDGTGYFFVDSFDGGLGSHWDIPALDAGGIVEVTTDFSVDPRGRSLVLRPGAPGRRAERGDSDRGLE